MAVNGMHVCAEVSAEQIAEQIAEALKMLNSSETDCIAHLRDGLTRYLVNRIPTGGFLRHVLENDLAGAMAHANPAITMRDMKALTQLLHCGFPTIAWGSPEKVTAWLAKSEI